MKINKSNSIEAIDRTDLSEQTKFRLDELIENFENLKILVRLKIVFMEKLIKENHAIKN